MPSMSEYEAKIRNAANLVTGMRASGGTTATTLTLGLLSVLVSKNKITKSDLEVVFEVERQGAESTIREWYSQNQGDPDFNINNEVERDEVIKMCHVQVDKMREFVESAASDIAPGKSPGRKRSQNETKKL